jgi:hypothetical protein
MPSRRMAGAVVAGVMAGALVGAVVTYVSVAKRTTSRAEQLGRQAAVHSMGHDVMPFSLEHTIHVFEMTLSGGIQDVVARDEADTAQVRLIRQHLTRESMRFSAGDFSDPATLHGQGMPGIRELARGVGRFTVAYRELPAGARITFTSEDPILVTAIHRWFGAQLSDHGPDATYR